MGSSHQSHCIQVFGSTEEGFGDSVGEELYRKACNIALGQAEEIWCGNTTKAGCKITVTTHRVAPDAVPQNEADEEDPSPLHVVYDSKMSLEKLSSTPELMALRNKAQFLMAH